MNLATERIEQASLQDVDKLERLINSAYRGESSKEGWTTEADLLGGIRIDRKSLEELILAHNSVILKFTDDNNLWGCVNLVTKEKAIYLGMLTVSPTEQQKGIGKKLIMASESYARVSDLGEIEMTVISKRPELIAYYERRGYQQTGEKRPFPMNDPRFGEPKTDLEFIVLRKSLER
ncbi:MAG: N-acetylglutamate synthase-like GNAT family acetyltransferase [Oceanospirillaceae bacterium]|jgi:N-acetylglutamate synthase-like GNAT family acetyltransferase